MPLTYLEMVLQPESRKVATVTFVADTICADMQHGYYLTAQTQEVSEDMLSLIGLDAVAIDEIRAQLPEQFAEAEQIFGDL